MEARRSYQAAAATSWTRVDMLLLIYDNAISALTGGINAIADGNQAELMHHRFKAQKAVLLLADGLDLEQGEVPQKVMQLCAFALECISGDSADDWTAARNVLNNLREAFDQIRGEANQLEISGAITPLAV